MGWVNNAEEGVLTDGPMITGVAAAMSGLCIILVSLRLYVRLFLIRAFGHDDWLIVVSLIGACGYSISAIVQTTWGLGLRYLEDMPDENLINFGKWQYGGAPFYVLGLYGFKMSLLCSYMRFVPRPYYIACIAIAVIITMAHIAFVCVFLFICIPISMQWDSSVTGRCADTVTFYLTFSALTLVFDVVVMVIPFPVLLTSQIQKRKKIVLLGLFALGTFVTIIQIIRIQTIKNLANYLDSAKSIRWSIVEVCIGIIIACIPTLAPLIKYYHEKTRSGTASNSRRPASKYVLQSWKTGMSGQRPPGNDSEREPGIETRIIASSGDSTENILDTSGITKTTDVHIMRGRVSSESSDMGGRA
ncbi:integral membrane protein [Paramyrothecium foliicola]|nr:integral membrane protein [Paramyrothecium foliicola]